MKSQWYELKERAVKLRKKGNSIGSIERALGIPRSTLSGWFKDVKITKKQKEILFKKQKAALKEARKKAVIWHNKQKEQRLKEAEKAARKTLKNINIKSVEYLELAMAFLYLGEGSKKNTETAIGSSDPDILNFFLAGLKKVYNMDIRSIRCELYLRADQDPEKIKRYWSRVLYIPLDNFKQVNIDKRTKGTVTYSYYKGVCNLRCGNVAIQRRLVFLAKLFYKKISSQNKGV